MSCSDSDAKANEDIDFIVTVTPEDLSTDRDSQVFAEQMQQAICEAQKHGSSRLALDLSEVSQIRSVGLNSLIAVNSSSRCVGLSVVLLNIQASVREVFSLTRLERMFEFEERPAVGSAG
ncbi:MAG: STAS domain-containing protein [Rubripirellula sp.]|nr:STAS domain-containing protein [Rubripirellula sp.]